MFLGRLRAATPTFLAADVFGEERQGYVYKKTGPLGAGYYMTSKSDDDFMFYAR